MKKIIEKIKENKDIVIILIYMFITFLVTVFFHENWRDEAQAWMIARDLDFIGIIKQMIYEGHPPLWHIILMLFTKLGFPYRTLNFISLSIMWLTAYIVIKKAPFRPITKALILFSSGFIYYYPTIARSYCLIPLAITLIAIYYPTRNKNKIKYVLSILLLAYTHVLMLGLVGILFLFFFLEQIFYTKKNKKEIRVLIIALTIAVLGLLCLLLMLFGSVGKNSEVSVSGLLSLRTHSIEDVKILVKIYVKHFKRTLNNLEGAIFGPIGRTSGFQTVAIIAFVFIAYYIFKKNTKQGIILSVAFLWQIFIYIFIYDDTSNQKANTLFLIFLLIAWLLYTDKENMNNEKLDFLNNKVTIICLFMLVLSDIFGLTSLQNEIKYSYSDAKQVAHFLENNTEDNAVITGINGPTMSSIIPYTHDMKFWNASSRSYFTYMIWDEEHNEELSIEETVKRVKEEFSNKDNLYLLESNEKYSLREKHIVEIEKLQKEGILSDELYESDIDKTVMKEETYKIYKINL